MVNKYYQKNKEKLQKKANESTKIFLMKKKKKSVIRIEIKIFLKKKNKRKLRK